MTNNNEQPANPAIALNKALFDLIEQVRTSGAPTQVLAEASKAINQISQDLQPYHQPGPYSAANLDQAGKYDRESTSQADIMSFSPIIGNLNPISPEFEIHYIEKEDIENEGVEGKDKDKHIEGRGVFPVSWTGPPNTVHGGMVAAVCDELLTSAVMANGPGAFTGTLTIRYLARTKILEETELFAKCTKHEGRKIYAQGEIRQNGVVTAMAEGVFIQPKNHS